MPSGSVTAKHQFTSHQVGRSPAFSVSKYKKTLALNLPQGGRGIHTHWPVTIQRPTVSHSSGPPAVTTRMVRSAGQMLVTRLVLEYRWMDEALSIISHPGGIACLLEATTPMTKVAA